MALFSNQASLSYNGKTVLSNLAIGELVDVLSVTKTAGVDGYQNGTSIPYVINLRNTGSAQLTDLVITDDLGAYPLGPETLVPLTYIENSIQVFVDGTPQSPPSVNLTPSLVFSGIRVPADGVTTILYSAEVNAFASPETTGEITNTVTVTGATPELVTASATVKATAEADLTMQKSVSPSVARQGDTLTYTILIENHGSVAATDVTVEDIFQPILMGLVVSLDGVTWTEGTQYNYDEATGLFQSLVDSITVPAATFTQDPDTGVWTNIPGSTVLTVTGTF